MVAGEMIDRVRCFWNRIMCRSYKQMIYSCFFRSFWGYFFFMELNRFDRVICRTPAFSFSVEMCSVWPELKKLIKESSPAFFEMIKDFGSEDLARLPLKTQFTLWKYFNRSVYRSTPFGGFASVSMIHLGAAGEKKLTLQAGSQFHLYADWTNASLDHLAASDFSESTLLRLNSTCYTLGNEIRYLHLRANEFQLSSLPLESTISAILHELSRPDSAASILERVSSETELSRGELMDILHQLKEEGLIYTQYDRNITGTDYFRRLGHRRNHFDTYYRIDTRKVIGGGLSSHYAYQLQLYFSFLHQARAQPKSAGLQQFVTKFKQMYGQTAVPLGQVLDPEVGIGYLNLGMSAEDSGHDRSVEPKQPGQPDVAVLSDPITRFLIAEMTEKEEINLEEFKSDAPQVNTHLPNTFSAVVSMMGEYAVLESAGGCTANALLGRFTFAGDDFLDQAKTIAHVEQDSNPDVVFFELAYAYEGAVDNVNRRRHIYEYEFTLVGWTDSTHQIQLSDIWVILEGDEIILWSASLGKRLVPRMSSAYNYHRSSLALFRFLGDFQCQSLQVDLGFRLPELLPGCRKYPRVWFQELIVSPAMWQVPEDFKGLLLRNPDSAFGELMSWLRENKVGRYFSYGSGDQTMMFDSLIPDQLKRFLQLIDRVRVKESYITEAYPPRELVTDESGNPFNPQFILQFYHRQPVYQSPRSPMALIIADEKAQSATKCFLPGSEWLYLEIYCSPSRSNTLLTDIIHPLLNDLERVYQKWFFIRYNDPAPHIRLRINFRNKRSLARSLSKIHLYFHPLISDGIIKDLQIKTYFPELQRYGAAGISKVEDVFYKDSVSVMNCLMTRGDLSQAYCSALLLMDRAFSLSHPDPEARLSLVTRAADMFAKEMRWDISSFKRINQSYNQLKSCISAVSATSPGVSTDAVLASIGHLFSSLSDAGMRERLVVDLVHMHVNRLFEDNQRYHEATLYQYLMKFLKYPAIRSRHLLLS